SDRHKSLLVSQIKKHCRARVIGCIPKDAELGIPSRHLGLTTDVAGILTPRFVRKLTAAVEAHIDLGMLLDIASRADVPDSGAVAMERAPRKSGAGKYAARLAVAMDEAFCFYYRENIELLESCGIEAVPFSPLKDGGLPEGVSGIYIGGGYPEMYARGLSFNDFVKRGILEAAEAGIPVYAECGGLMYLSEGITDLDGVYYPMVGLIPARARMLPARKALGYREAEVISGTIFPMGEKARGHEFHYSDIEVTGKRIRHPYRVRKAGDKAGVKEGFCSKNVLASYVHLHFMSNRKFAKSFAERIKRARALR
ncbi:MAG: cobyrinate a,c-diamide synthase, partial [Nitrospirota bacterium]